MNKYLALFLFSLLTSQASFSLDKNALDECSTIQRDVDRGGCVHLLYQAEDKALNERYIDLRKALSEEHQELLKQSQIAWLKYRDADCGLEAAAYTGGTLHSVVYSSCLLKKTENRVQELIRLCDVWDM